MNHTSLRSDLRQVIYALSNALDLVGIDDVAHGKRVGIMAAECGKVLGLAQAETTFLFDLGLLHDIGVSTTETHYHLISEFDWDGSQVHAEKGFAILREFAPLSRMALPVRYHHTHWEQLRALSPAQLTAQQAQEANLIFMVDRVDALAGPYHGGNRLFDHVGEIRAQIARNAGSYFAPELVDAFMAASETEAFWLLLEPYSIQSYLYEMLAHDASYQPSFGELRQLAVIFSHIVDAKSEFTAHHSLGVARLARFLAECAGIGKENCDKLELAGLLHDLGKLRVPDEILDKPGRLDTHERRIINTHSFETYRILRNIGGFEELALWAAYHHEEPDGTGYPFHIHGKDMPTEARILRVADIFQALAQDRPYRAGLPAHEVLAFLNEQAEKGRLDAAIVGLVGENMEQAMATALPGPGDSPFQRSGAGSVLP
ncbi:MAG: phosphodiesterase [Gallionellales bacterium GWA2_60_18]|nr:MAG: phosphodiesterase [Gallionellales bacterium GWA2_60_18]